MQLRRMAVRSRERQHLAVHSVNGPMLGIAKSGCVLNQRIQHRLQVKSRAAYDFQYFAGRRLLVQRFGEIAVAFLQFFEQSHVLDGDNGLIGKGFEQCNVFF